MSQFFAFGHGVKGVITENVIGDFDSFSTISNLCETRIAHEIKKRFLELYKNKRKNFQRFFTLLLPSVTYLITQSH